MGPVERIRWLLAVAGDKKLPPSALAVAVAIAQFTNARTALCSPSAATIAGLIGSDDRTVRRSVRALEASGWLLVSRSGGRKANTYRPRNPVTADRVACGANPVTADRVERQFNDPQPCHGNPGSPDSPVTATLVAVAPNPDKMPPPTLSPPPPKQGWNRGRTGARGRARETATAATAPDGVSESVDRSRLTAGLATDSASEVCRAWGLPDLHTGDADATTVACVLDLADSDGHPVSTDADWAAALGTWREYSEADRQAWADELAQTLGLDGSGAGNRQKGPSEAETRPDPMQERGEGDERPEIVPYVAATPPRGLTPTDIRGLHPRLVCRDQDDRDLLDWCWRLYTGPIIHDVLTDMERGRRKPIWMSELRAKLQDECKLDTDDYARAGIIPPAGTPAPRRAEG